MTQAEHEERLRKIAAETEEIKRQIMQVEFQHMKDTADADRRFETWNKAMTAKQDHTQRQIDHLVNLIGLTYDELDEIDATLTEAGVILTRPSKRARIK
ncbi:MAG: hypothetical protein ABIP78_06645 [Pyrinomonadaceae bacterium]